jgi:hypothetical protein
MFRVLTVSLGMLLVVGAARASPFWVSWEDGWPDQQGWLEGSSDPPAQKWLEDGLLFIDSRAAGGYDGYYQNPASLMPGPQETFAMHWRVRVDESWPTSDPGVIVRADDHYSVAFSMDRQSIHSNYEPGKWALFAPNEFHDFVVQSTDMRAYELYIDGALALQGTFFESLFPGPSVAWGDLSSAMSLAPWDSVQYGIMPEPSPILCLLIPLCYARSLRRSATPKSRHL